MNIVHENTLVIASLKAHPQGLQTRLYILLTINHFYKLPDVQFGCIKKKKRIVCVRIMSRPDDPKSIYRVRLN